MKKFNEKLLSTTVSSLMTMVILSATTATQSSDIDIYKLPDDSEVTVFMMLDTSGSMDLKQVDNSPCEVSSSNAQIVDVPHPENRGYTRNYCQVGGTVTYRFRLVDATRPNQSNSWRSCGSGTSGSTSSTCNNAVNSVPDVRGFLRTKDNRYVTVSGGTQAYDRISRLKDALYEIATTDKIPPKTKIGIGTYPVIESSSLTNRKGRVRITAAEWGAVGSNQRKALLDLIRGSGFVGQGGTPTSAAYAEAAAYMLGTHTGGGNYSDSSSNYTSPLTKTLDPKCSGKGIYFLTDGQPQSPAAAIDSNFMSSAFQNTVTNFSSGLSATGAANENNTHRSDWVRIGGFARALNNGSNLQRFFSSTQRNNEHKIMTAVVGFGSVFDVGNLKQTLTDPLTEKTAEYYDCKLITDVDAKNACNWGSKSKFSDGVTTTISGTGGYGEGGFYSAQNTEQVISSFVTFVEDMKPIFDPIATGSPTLPVDALNPIQLQPYGYYAKFTPKPQENYQLWLGDLNKYQLYNGQLYNPNKTKRLIIQNSTNTTNNGKLDNAVEGFWGLDGVKGKLALGTLPTVNTSARKILTNRTVTNGVATATTTLQPVNLTTLFGGTLQSDPKKNYWLNALGYSVAENQTNLTANNLPAPTAAQRQLGAVMHSQPILLTQEGKIEVPTSGDNKGQITSKDRKDYVLFGTNQGMLHVVEVGDESKTGSDYLGGKEVFAFVPHEMMEKQAKGFLPEGNTNSGRDNLYYGIDGAWTAHTQYVSKADGSLTVKDSGLNSGEDDDLTNQGLQWVYGGLRMGGRSYYALDLTNINSPSLKFHINPDAHTSGPLSYMGQSWSKPTLTYVNWGGERKLVMLVGGGYDTEYEKPAYNQMNQKGAGVYMFDADNGDLLWWASANVDNSSGSNTTSGTIKTKVPELKYSVVSQINAIDRDADGLSDILYFGDLGGQAFRVDLNNKANAIGGFAKRVVRLYNGNVNTGASPRFYEMPSFSVHTGGVDGVYGVLALSSGNRSSPLAGTVTNLLGQALTPTVSANDAVFVIYDNDVARRDLYDITDNELRTKPNVTLKDLVLKDGVPQVDGDSKYNGGWKYHYHSIPGKYKGMNGIFALDSMLYVNVYHKDGAGIANDCGSGVIGDSELYQFCLPTGKCDFYNSGTNSPNKVILGGGILGSTLGQGYNNDPTTLSLVVKKDDGHCEKPENKNNPECQLFDNKAGLQHLRWYESR